MTHASSLGSGARPTTKAAITLALQSCLLDSNLCRHFTFLARKLVWPIKQRHPSLLENWYDMLEITKTPQQLSFKRGPDCTWAVLRCSKSTGLATWPIKMFYLDISGILKCIFHLSPKRIFEKPRIFSYAAFPIMSENATTSTSSNMNNTVDPERPPCPWMERTDRGGEKQQSHGTIASYIECRE